MQSLRQNTLNKGVQMTDDIDFCPEGVFGLIDEALDKMETVGGHRPKKIVPRAPRALPQFKINKQASNPSHENVEFTNVVSVPDTVLRQIASTIDTRTAVLNRLLMTDLLPLLLSYDTSTNYTRAVFKDALNLEIDFDPGLAEAVKQIGYLNVLFYFVKQSKLPRSIKQVYMNTISTKLAEQAVSSIVETNKTQNKIAQLQELQAVVYSQRDKKATVHTKSDEKAPTQPAGVSRKSSQR